MDLSQIKLVATDMDGTLLNSNHEVSDLFFNLFKELKKHNILFVAASGRPYYSITEKLDPIKNDIIIVAENGSIVGKNGTEILSTPLPNNNLFEVEKLIDKHNHIHPVFCTKHKAYFKNSSDGFIKLLTEYYPNYSLIDSIKEIDEDILKIALYNHEDARKQIYPLFNRFDTEYKVIVSGKHWVDIFHIEANKGKALSIIQKQYNISSEQTIAIGDYDNDIEMLLKADFSFAMENANSNVKRIAKFNTKSNNEFGVETILEKLIEAKKASV
ncbi:Cof-type HAD-IIB family hydrolase [Flavobacteriaceae bacterium XHP0103]|uniref:HAD family hydrolase n=1 Tax=Marixanthotalea marina TaxID=2844359 RepID=UPI002989AD5B|nr:HAD family hydrolase [Marixanthotalea marina]MBU3821435.1 Cof-type HAD-IIB family hydrolase [Marixanthotalea marina]